MFEFSIALVLWIISSPLTYAYPLYLLEKDFVTNDFREIHDAEAIVILGGRITDNTNFKKPNLSDNLLERVRFGAFLQRETGLPILVSGKGSHSKFSEAQIMKRVLEEEFHASVEFVEDRSATTKENAEFSLKILDENNIKKIFLVSNSWHLKRAFFLFSQQSKNMEIIPVANYFYNDKKFVMEGSDFIPNLSTLHYQRKFYYEYFAFFYYKYLNCTN
jgi:uncharacterized SAM-binding protein YcdF (DUF218 family)